MSTISRTRYLFPEAAVTARLATLPAIARKLRNAAERDTLPSTAFPGYATNPRQLYRVLAGAPVYPWLDRLLGSLEFCMEHGWYSSRIMTSDRQQFRGAIGEAHVAEHFLLRGGELEPEPESADGRADLRVILDGVEAIVEVVAPIEWGALNDFFETVGDALKNLDESYDFRGRVGMTQLDTFGVDGELLYLNPIVLAKQLAGTTIVQDIAVETAAMLSAGEPFQIERAVPDLNVRVTADFTEVERATTEPARMITFDLPGLSGYAPEAVFGSILGKVRKKAQQRQAGDAHIDALRLLVVDISTGEVAAEFRQDWYRAEFERMFRARLGALVGVDYDGIALVEPRGWGEQLILHQLLHEDERLTRAAAEQLFELAPTAGAPA